MDNYDKDALKSLLIIKDAEIEKLKAEIRRLEKAMCEIATHKRECWFCEGKIEIAKRALADSEADAPKEEK